MGPPLRKEPFTSGGFVKSVMEGTMNPIPSSHMPAVDVRDVALAHLRAVQRPEAANKRFILCNLTPSFLDYAAPLIAKYRPLGWPISENKADADPNEYVCLFDNTASKEILGIVYHDFNQSMLDMAEKMIELGTIVKPSQ